MCAVDEKKARESSLNKMSFGSIAYGGVRYIHCMERECIMVYATNRDRVFEWV